MQRRKVFRSSELHLMGVGLGWVFLVSALLVLVPGPGEAATRYLVSALLAASGLFDLLRFAPQGIYADAVGVDVRRVFSRRKIPWAQISRFEIRQSWQGMIAFVDLTDGTSISAPALNGGSGLLPSMQRRSQTQIDELNALLVEARGHQPAPPPARHEAKKPWEYPGFVIAFQGPAVAILFSLTETSMRPFMLAYGVASFVGGLAWFWKQKRDEAAGR